MSSSTGGSFGQQGTQGTQGTQGMQGNKSQTPSMQQGMGQRQTGTPDPTFDLISIVYHCLKGATTYQQYIQDAQGDQELTQFFQQCIQENTRTADKAKQLLGKRLTSSTAGH